MKINNKVEEGERIIDDFVLTLVERNRVPEDKRAEERERLKNLIMDRIFDEMLAALPDEDLKELEEIIARGEEVSIDKWNSMMFMAGVRPESVKDKVFREVERDFLGVENVESDEDLMEAEEEGM